MRKYWTYDKCKEVSLKCESKIELEKLYGSAYNSIHKNKWFGLFSHFKVIGNKYKRLIYVYEFSDNHCYIGLTGNMKHRNRQHLGKDLNSSVYRYTIVSGLKPNLHIKTEYISVEKAILLESKILNEYKENGWLILNKIKTGGIGSKNIKWNIEECKKESKKYNKIIDFQRGSKSCYNSSLKNGWIDEICFHMKRCKTKNGYWDDKELCRVESKKYRNKKDFYKGCWSAWSYSKKNGWLDEFFISKNLPVVQQSK